MYLRYYIIYISGNKITNIINIIYYNRGELISIDLNIIVYIKIYTIKLIEFYFNTLVNNN